VSEVSPEYRTRSEREREIEAAIEGLTEIWEQKAGDVPDWVAQELTFSQTRLLFHLSKHGPSPIGHVAEWLGVGVPTASGAIDRLERHGLVTREHRRDDRRVVECGLTQAGHELLDKITGMRLEMVRRFLEVLTEDELGEMARLITIVCQRTRAQIE